MIEYNKIETVFNRDTDGSKKLIEGSYCSPIVGMIRNCMWNMTEKIDGTNISVCWNGHKIEFHGRTAKAQIQSPLVNWLTEKFINEETEELFEQVFGDKEAVLFGEGYGKGIQTGGSYIPNGVSFILFDVMVNGKYLARESVESIATTFNVDVVPVLFTGTLQEGIDFVKTHPKSTIGEANMEGVVARPVTDVYDRSGNRVMVKIKCRDFI